MRSALLHPPRVLVLLAIYNPNPSYLREQLSSIISQVGCVISILIGDDSPSGPISRSDLLSICPLLEHHLVAILVGPRIGLPSANFLTLFLSDHILDHDYIAFADQDDLWLPVKIESAISFLVNYSDPACYSSELIVWNHVDAGQSFSISTSWRSRSRLYGLLFARGAGCTRSQATILALSNMMGISTTL
jgi:rhamnosyltransferase